MKPVINVLDLDKNEIVWTDSTTFASDTIVGKIAAGLIPVSTRTGTKARHLYIVKANGEMLKPVDPATGEYFNAEGQVRDLRGSYTYA